MFGGICGKGGGGWPRKGLGNEGNLFASGCDGKSGGIGGGLGSCDNNEGIFSEESESLVSLELTRMGIPTEQTKICQT